MELTSEDRLSTLELRVEALERQLLMFCPIGPAPPRKPSEEELDEWGRVLRRALKNVPRPKYPPVTILPHNGASTC